VLHAGVTPEQFALLVHTTHKPATVSHAGVAPPHWLVLPAEHCPHAPDGSHAGVPPPQSVSPLQARHACVPESHTGVAPEHCALLVHCTQPTAMMHRGVAPPHAVQAGPQAAVVLHVVQPAEVHFIGSLNPPLSVTLPLAVFPAARSRASDCVRVALLSEVPQMKRKAPPVGTRAFQLAIGTAQSMK
jgi:hypothetical protein